MSHIFYTKGEPMNRVKNYRLLLGISQLDLAKAIGVSRQAINMIENNKYNPSLDLCINLAKALQTDLNSLFWNIPRDRG
jgi:putative transcriptional regulator